MSGQRPSVADASLHQLASGGASMLWTKDFVHSKGPHFKTLSSPKSPSVVRLNNTALKRIAAAHVGLDDRMATPIGDRLMGKVPADTKLLELELLAKLSRG